MTQVSNAPGQPNQQELARLLALVAERTTNPVMVTDAMGVTIWINDAVVHKTGYTAQELLGRRPNELLCGPDSDPAVSAAIRDHVRRGEAIRAQILHYTKSREEFYVDLDLQPVKDGQGIATHWLIVEQDVTERYKAEQSIRDSEMRLRTTYEYAPLGLAHAALDGRWLRVNPKFCQIVGYSEQELLKMTWQQMTHPEDLPEDLRRVRLLLARKFDNYSLEKRYLRKNGSVVWVNITVSAVNPESDAGGYMVSVIEDITWRRQAEEAVRDSEHRLRQFAELSDDVVFIFDLAPNRPAYVSPSIERLFGVSIEAFMADPELWIKMTHPEDAAEVMKNRRQALEGDGGDFRATYRIIRPDNDIRWISDSAKIIRDEHGVAIRLTGLAKDVTEQKQAELALRDSEAKLKEAQRIARLGRWELNLVTRQLTWSEETFNIFEQLPGDRGDMFDAFSRMTHPQDLDFTRESFYQAVAQRKPYELVHRLIMPDGRIKYVHERAQCVYDAQGRPLRAVGTVQDITDVKFIEQELREAQRKLSTLIGNLPGMVYRCRNEPEWPMLFASQGTLALTGYPPEDFTEGRVAYSSIIHPDDRQRVWEEAQRAVESRQNYQYTYRIRTASGQERWIWGQGVGVYDSQNQLTHLEGVALDVTDRRQAEERFRQHDQEMLRVSRLVMAGELASGLAHELNQPLCAIANFAQAAERQLGQSAIPPVKVLDMLRDIASEALRAGSVIRHLRDLIQKQETHQIPVDVPVIIDTAIRLIHGDARKMNIDIQTRVARNLPQVRGDRIQLEQVLLNLLRNAMEAVAAGGAERTVIIQADHRSDRIELSVADRGMGLDAHIAANLFEPFLTTKSSGLGVGLYLCRSIIEAHNGRIWHQPNDPQGAIFHISLPVLGTFC